MSVSVSAVPFLLFYAIGQGVISTTNVLSAVVQGMTSKGDSKLHIDEVIAEQLFNKEFQTSIMDRNVLIKTLEEHGASDISQDGADIICNCDNFHLTFQKQLANLPYTVKISYNEEQGLDELMENLGSEYAINAQEISYNKIKERLEKQNFEISEEEVYDDNTIVLTVNLD